MTATVPIKRIASVLPLYRNPSEPLPMTQRLASGVAGASLLVSGVRRGGLLGVVMAAAGADLVYRGCRGGGHVSEMIHLPERKTAPGPSAQQAAA